MKIRTIVTITVLILALITISTTTAAAIPCDCGDICVNETGWWRDGGVLTASTIPIQAAVNNAGSGETICVAAGSYTENVDITISHLTLQGEGAGLVTVTGADPDNHVFEVTADYVNISGFYATGVMGYLHAGIYLDGVDHCNISENTVSENSYGIYLFISSNYNTLVNNTASNNIHGIYLWDSSNNTLTSNTANSNIDHGIYLYHWCNNNTFVNNTANSNGDYGICLYHWCNNNTLMSNTANSNNQGIWLYCSSNNTLTSNTMSENMYNFGIPGSSLSEFTQNIDTSNTVDGKPIYYWIDQRNRQIPGDAGFVGVVNGTNITVRNLTLTNNGEGVLFAYTKNSRIKNVTASNNDHGIQMAYSSNNTLSNNTVNSNDLGIWLRSSSENMLSNNTASNNDCGIWLYSLCNNNTLSNNTADSNKYRGIYLCSSSNNNMLTKNTANSNGDYDIYLGFSSDNLIYNNYFNNTKNAYDDGSNQWNTTKTNGTNIIGGPFLGGNYWSNYAGVDNDGDGLGDTLTPYTSLGGITNDGDYHPLVPAASPDPTYIPPDPGDFLLFSDYTY